ncbi:hypothetical protein DLAC_06246 [Tieghemostelium lacteum]|uniref:ATP synthase subunit d, mitochondrial n=1 Tax=Tieghemostelium lacteum TaxID=361077 RepID=A0A151ZI41_TIELA|nr:hypothetical protein DLAC_06246 [Tieghemostelium lacteum]|eukprot:KYQ93540.1 hypothetical protein DLAC_06246 [Tieghemostelium lacteum]
MLRYGLRLFRAAEHSATKVEKAQIKSSSSINSPEHIKPFLAGLESLPEVKVTQGNSSEQIDQAYDDLMKHPLLSRDPEIMKVYNEASNADKLFNNFNPLPEVSAEASPLDWNFYKKILPSETIDHFKSVYEKTIQEIDSWKADEERFVKYALNKIDSDRDSQSFTQELDVSLAEIDRQIKQNDNFIQNLDKITFEEMEGKYPDIEQEIYDEIENNEWMPKDKVGDDLIWNVGSKHHH